jgi:hypothetical protein
MDDEIEFAVGKLLREIAHGADNGSPYASKIEAWEKRFFCESNFPQSTAGRLIRHFAKNYGWTARDTADHTLADLVVCLNEEEATAIRTDTLALRSLDLFLERSKGRTAADTLLQRKVVDKSDSIRLNDTENAIVQALGECGDLKGSDLAAKAGYTYDSHFKSVCSSLRKRRIIENTPGRGYHLPQKSGPGQD